MRSSAPNFSIILRTTGCCAALARTLPAGADGDAAGVTAFLAPPGVTEKRSEGPAEAFERLLNQTTLLGAEGQGNHLLSAGNLDGHRVCLQRPFALFQGVGRHAMPRVFQSGEQGIADAFEACGASGATAAPAAACCPPAMEAD